MIQIRIQPSPTGKIPFLPGFLWLLLTFVSICGLSCVSNPENVKQNNADLSEWEVLNELVSKYPDEDSIYAKRADFLMGKESYDSAIADYLMALSIDSTGNPQYYFGLSRAYMMSAQSKMASDVLDRAMRAFPENIPTLLKTAEMKLVLKQYMPVLAILDKVFLRDPQHAEAWYLSGHVFYEMGDTGRAVNAYQKTVDLNPEMRKAWIQLGDVLTELKIEKALEYYDNAIRLDTLDPEVYHSKAYAYHRLGKRDMAISLFKKIAIRFPSYEPGIYNLALIYLESDSLPQAIEHFNICIQLKPTEPSTYYQRALAYLRKGSKDLAKADLQNALRLNPDFQDAKNELAKL